MGSFRLRKVPVFTLSLSAELRLVRRFSDSQLWDLLTTSNPLSWWWLPRGSTGCERAGWGPLPCYISFKVENAVLSIHKLTILHFSLVLWASSWALPHGGEHLICTTAYSGKILLWLVSLNGLSASLQTKGLPVRFPVRAHAWVTGQVPSGGHTRGNHALIFFSPSLSLSLPLCLKINK